MDDLISRLDALSAVGASLIGQLAIKGDTAEWREVLKSANEMILELPSARRWIPVTERLPVLNDDGASDPVLLCWADRQIVVGFYAGDETFYAQSFPFAADGTARITAWMPLPDPYGGEE